MLLRMKDFDQVDTLIGFIPCGFCESELPALVYKYDGDFQTDWKTLYSENRRDKLLFASRFVFSYDGFIN